MSWSPLQLIGLGVLGLLAGAINAVAGGGSLLTFPALIAFGLPALTANLSNTVAQCPGYLAIVHGYRPELAGQRQRIRGLTPAVVLGGVAGVALLEIGSPATFRVVAPALILLACALLALQSRLRDALERRQAGQEHPRWGLSVAVAIACAYASYFGAAAGVLLLAVLAIFIVEELQRLNALNRFFILLVNVLAAMLFVLLGPVNWTAIAVLAPTTVIGGRVGVSVVRRLGASTLRAAVLLVGLVAAGYLIATSW
jgi:uncharacterized membrane protein YfcA